MVNGKAGRVRGSAVLVHGGWGNPDDWRWVRDLLEKADLEVAVPDLPTHRSPRYTVADDVEEVRRAIRSLAPPVVAVGWSYGGEVIGVAADGEPSVSRLVFVSSTPLLASAQLRDVSWIAADPHVQNVGGAVALDNEWWFKAEAERLFSGEVLEHFRHHPRRPAALATMTDPLPAAAWQTIPTTVLIGRADHLIGEEERAWMTTNLTDVRFLDSDHFIIFRQPEVVARTVLESIP